MITCACGRNDDQCIVGGVRVSQSGSGGELWVSIRLLKDDPRREYVMYLDANGLVALSREIKTALAALA